MLAGGGFAQGDSHLDGARLFRELFVETLRVRLHAFYVIARPHHVGAELADLSTACVEQLLELGNALVLGLLVRKGKQPVSKFSSV